MMRNSPVQRAHIRNQARLKELRLKEEFYTQYEDLVSEVLHYELQFPDKTVYLNCDDYRTSKIFKFFEKYFRRMELKNLIATCLSKDGEGYKAVYRKGKLMVYPLEGDGDFRSPACIELLKEADIVVTCPPFNLFREYVHQLMEHDKKFLVLGPGNAILYREIFPYIQSDRMWLGHCMERMKFRNTHGALIDVDAQWYTNLDLARRTTPLELTKSYSEKEYPKYDNFNAIEVNVSRHIPQGYAGLMGVPTTFLQFHNPEQFKIMGMRSANGRLSIQGKELFARILIQAVA